MLSPKGEYDYKIEENESTLKTWVKQQVHHRKQMLQVDIAIDNKVYKDITEDDEIYAYKHKMARELIKIQADAFYKKQQKML